MSNRNNMIPIPGRLHSVAVGEPISGADEVLDDALNMEQSEINQLTVGTKNASTGTTGAYPYNGMGRVVLPKNMVNGVNTLTQDMLYKGDPGSRVPNTNTIFVISYDYVLGEDITVPANCVLEFDGGSLSGGTLVGNNTRIIYGGQIFSNIVIEGTWNVPYIDSIMFAEIGNNNLKHLFALTSSDVYNKIVVRPGNYNVSILQDGVGCWALGIQSNTDVVIDGNISLTPFYGGSGLTYGYWILRTLGDNISISGGGTITGDRVTSTTKSTESGHAICISNNNVSVHGLHLNDAYGEGVAVQSGDNVIIENCTIEGYYRNGISVVNGGNSFIYNCIFKNGGYSSPKAIVDIEPNENDTIKNVHLKNLVADNCHDGIHVLVAASGSHVDNVVIENVTINEAHAPLYINGGGNYQLENLSINNVVINKNSSALDLPAGERFCTFSGANNLKASNLNINIETSINTTNNGILTNCHNLIFENCKFVAIGDLFYMLNNTYFKECEISTLFLANQSVNCVYDSCLINSNIIFSNASSYNKILNSKIKYEFYDSSSVRKKLNGSVICQIISAYNTVKNSHFFISQNITPVNGETQIKCVGIAVESDNNLISNNIFELVDDDETVTPGHRSGDNSHNYGVIHITSGYKNVIEHNKFINFITSNTGSAGDECLIRDDNNYATIIVDERSSGPYADKPTFNPAGFWDNDKYGRLFRYYATDLNKFIWWTSDSTKGDNGWIDASGNAPT